MREDKLREQDRVMEVFRNWYNEQNSSEYEVSATPDREEEYRRGGDTYDYACKNKGENNPELAVEVTELYKDTENVKENVRLFGTDDGRKNFRLYLKGKLKQDHGVQEIRFHSLPLPQFYQKVVEDIQKCIETSSMNLEPPERIFRQEIKVGRDLQVSYTMRVNTERPASGTFPHVTLDENRFESDEQVTIALLRVIVDNQKKLKTAREKGKSSILVISNKYCYAEVSAVDGWMTLKDHFGQLRPECHDGIDEIYALVEQRNDKPFEVAKLK